MSDGTPTAMHKRLNSPLTWHFAGFMVLLLVAFGLIVRMGFDWTAIDRHAEQVAAAKQVQLTAQELETAPLRGLDQKVDATRDALGAFYDRRVPPNYSSIAGHFVELAVKSGVRLSSVQYTQGAPGSHLTEISMDARISGDYPQIKHFINILERDQMFFVIRAMSLTGQSGGLVNLRLRVSTWLRPDAAAASGLPSTEAEGAALSGGNSPTRTEVE